MTYDQENYFLGGVTLGGLAAIVIFVIIGVIVKNNEHHRTIADNCYDKKGIPVELVDGGTACIPQAVMIGNVSR